MEDGTYDHPYVHTAVPVEGSKNVDSKSERTVTAAESPSPCLFVGSADFSTEYSLFHTIFVDLQFAGLCIAGQDSRQEYRRRPRVVLQAVVLAIIIFERRNSARMYNSEKATINTAVVQSETRSYNNEEDNIS